MKDYIELGSCPWNEEAVQVGDPDYRTNAIRECQAYIQAIRNYLGQEPDGAALAYRGFSHDFGTYYEVICAYDPELPDSMKYAFRCEKEAPATWADGGVKPPARVAQQRRSRGR